MSRYAMISRLAATAGLMALAACAVGPDYKRPPLAKDEPLPAAFKEARDLPANIWKPAAPQDETPRGPWWTLFGDDRMNGLQAQLSISNQNIRLAEAQYRQARALAREAASTLFPAVQANGDVTRQKTGSNAAAGSGTIARGPTTSFDAYGSASWEADVWGRLRRTAQAGSARAQASAADLESARLSAHSELALDYFLICETDAQLALLDDTIAAYRRSLEITQNRHTAGLAAKSDVTQAQTQLASAEASATDLRLTRAQLEHAIAVLLGRAPAVFSLAADRCAAALPAIPAALPSDLLERRPDIAAAERRMKAANADVGAAIGAFFPQINLTGSGGSRSTDFSQLFSAPTIFWSLGAGLAQTLFDGGLRLAQTAEARAAYDASVAEYRQTVLTAFQETEDNLAALRLLEQEAAEQARATAAANENLALVLNQYKAGTVGYLNVITAQTAALASQRADLTLQRRRTGAAASLIAALGGIWPASPSISPPAASPAP